MRLLNVKRKGSFLNVSQAEAVSLIVSLATQLAMRSANVGRSEYTLEGEPISKRFRSTNRFSTGYFTVIVEDAAKGFKP